MNFKIFSTRMKIIFCISIIFLFLTIANFVAYLVVLKPVLNLYLLLLVVWFGSATTLLFHYLLWQNLPFLQQIDLVKTNNYTITISLLVYIFCFPIIAFLTLVFLFIFVVAIFILAIVNMINHINNRKNKE